jgi:two-component sensor histidine kinase
MLETVRGIPVSEVFITDELAKRPAKKTDYLKEKQALMELASRMAGHPDEVLPRFVDLAMELTGGISAGISLYEENPAPGVFRWHYLRGTLAEFTGATTPRNFSPCGITLDERRPVLTRHSERMYDWISDANIVVPEVLLVPLYVGADEPLGTLWIVSDKEGHFDSGDARVAGELASFVTVAVHMLDNEKELRRQLEEQQTLSQEMNHRVQNLFAVTDGMIRISARDSGSKDEMAKTLSGRIRALADSHALVRRSAGGQAGTELTELLRTIVAPHQGMTGSGTRFSLQGPSLFLGPQASTGMALIFHEMATNATKHGALRSPDGRVAIRWSDEGGSLAIYWAESDGPEIVAAPGLGQGTKLLNDIVVRQFGGSLSYDLRASGLLAAMVISLSNLSR